MRGKNKRQNEKNPYCRFQFSHQLESNVDSSIDSIVEIFKWFEVWTMSHIGLKPRGPTLRLKYKGLFLEYLSVGGWVSELNAVLVIVIIVCMDPNRNHQPVYSSGWNVNLNPELPGWISGSDQNCCPYGEYAEKELSFKSKCNQLIKLNGRRQWCT